MTMNYRDISLADPILQRAHAHLMEVWPKLYPADPMPFLSQVHRTEAMQNAYFAQGRKGLHEVNELRKKANLAPLLPKENLYTVTNAPAGRSLHEKMPARAIDYAFVKKGTKKDLDWTPRLFAQVAGIMKKFDARIVWGGDWAGKKNDKPHFQI